MEWFAQRPEDRIIVVPDSRQERLWLQWIVETFHNELEHDPSYYVIPWFSFTSGALYRRGHKELAFDNLDMIIQHLASQHEVCKVTVTGDHVQLLQTEGE